MTGRDTLFDSLDQNEALYDAGEYLVAGPENHAEWWEHLGDAHRDYAALARAAELLQMQRMRLLEVAEAAIQFRDSFSSGPIPTTYLAVTRLDKALREAGIE